MHYTYKLKLKWKINVVKLWQQNYYWPTKRITHCPLYGPRLEECMKMIFLHNHFIPTNVLNKLTRLSLSLSYIYIYDELILYFLVLVVIDSLTWWFIVIVVLQVLAERIHYPALAVYSSKTNRRMLLIMVHFGYIYLIHCSMPKM